MAILVRLPVMSLEVQSSPQEISSRKSYRRSYWKSRKSLVFLALAWALDYGDLITDVHNNVHMHARHKYIYLFSFVVA
jgi:hypothetical protein